MIRIHTTARALALVLAFAGGLGEARASEAVAPASTVRDARIYYFGFEVQRMTGIPEGQMASVGCVYSADSTQLRQLLIASPPSWARYEPGNVRAKIEMPQEAWYIDANGIAKIGEKTVLVDRTAFVRLLSLDPGTPCPRQG